MIGRRNRCHRRWLLRLTTTTLEYLANLMEHLVNWINHRNLGAVQWLKAAAVVTFLHVAVASVYYSNSVKINIKRTQQINSMVANAQILPIPFYILQCIVLITVGAT